MKGKILFIFTILMIASLHTFSQQAIIKNEPVSPEKIIKMGLTQTTNSVSTGLNVVSNGVYVYLAPESMDETDPVTNASWSFVSKPVGSNADFNNMSDLWVNFKTDVKGAYNVKMSFTTAKGSHDTTLTVYAADFIGNPAFDGVQPQGLNCMSCHSSDAKFTDIYSRWQSSGHANIFKAQITTPTAHYSPSCMKCHTVGYDHNVVSNNNGFDDKATELGWKWQGPSNVGKWDTLKTQFPGLVAFAEIGCENCHGPASEHALGNGPKSETIMIDAAAGACASCHDEPWRHNKVSEYENSVHSEAIWESGFAQSSGSSYKNNSLGNCIRCHDGNGFINYTKGKTTETKGMTLGDHRSITCATCHDPHGNSNEFSLRTTPASGDTLGNGYAYTEGGVGKTCMSCHKARKDNVSYTKAKVTSSHWGPHSSVQTDVFLGKNAAEFGTAYNTTNVHTLVLQNACVDCHMQATTDTGTVTRDRVGGHSWKMADEEHNYDHTAKCQSCHPGKTKFSDFTAEADYDGNGNTESIQNEVKGLLTKLSIALPPAGIDSISWVDIGALNDEKINKAWWNYQLIANDGSYGMHNAQFAVAILQQSLATLTGVEPDNSAATPKSYELSQNFPNPFNPNTNIRFSIPVSGNVTLKIYDAVGTEVATLTNGFLTAGSYKVNWNAGNNASGVYFYKLTSKNFNMVKKMLLVK
ncbi:MAG: T9SS type A sorting domain-containing protein [Ignavibacteriales bacterium]|nr:T9SS type A sorting domain-containing protein [Ignavibacteriales bacterium]